MPNLRGKTWTTTTPANVNDAQFWEDHLLADADFTRLQSAIQIVNGQYADEMGSANPVPLGGAQGQVLTKLSYDDNDYEWRDPASSGHIIQDQHNVNMPYQPTLKFQNADVTNDSVGNKIVVDCHGEKGDDGKSAYQYAIDGGYTGTEEQFEEDLGNFQTYASTAESAAEDAEDALEAIQDLLSIPNFTVDFATGELMFTEEATYTFLINQTTGNLEWEVN